MRYNVKYFASNVALYPVQGFKKMLQSASIPQQLIGNNQNTVEVMSFTRLPVAMTPDMLAKIWDEFFTIVGTYYMRPRVYS